MRKLVVVAAAAALLLVGCTAEATTPVAEPPVATDSPAIVETPVSVEKSCDDYSPKQSVPPAGAEALQSALEAAPLPDGVSLNPGVQIITSVDRPGSFEAVVRVCAEGLTEDALTDTANGIAVDVKADPSSELLFRLVVSEWSPDGEYMKQGDTLTTEYQTYTWDTSVSRPMAGNWD